MKAICADCGDHLGDRVNRAATGGCSRFLLLARCNGGFRSGCRGFSAVGKGGERVACVVDGRSTLGRSHCERLQSRRRVVYELRGNQTKSRLNGRKNNIDMGNLSTWSQIS